MTQAKASVGKSEASPRVIASTPVTQAKASVGKSELVGWLVVLGLTAL